MDLRTLEANNRSLARQIQTLKTDLQAQKQLNLEQKADIQQLNGRIRRLEAVEDDGRFDMLVNEKTASIGYVFHRKMRDFDILLSEAISGLNDKVVGKLVELRKLTCEDSPVDDSPPQQIVPLLNSPRRLNRRRGGIFNTNERLTSIVDKKTDKLQNFRPSTQLNDVILPCDTKDPQTMSNLSSIAELEESISDKRDKIPRTPVDKKTAGPFNNLWDDWLPGHDSNSPVRHLHPMSSLARTNFYGETSSENNSVEIDKVATGESLLNIVEELKDKSNQMAISGSNGKMQTSSGNELQMKRSVGDLAPDDQAENPRPRRATCNANYKEPSLNKKMRR